MGIETHASFIGAPGSYNAGSRILNVGSGNTISNPLATRYKIVTGVNINDASDRGVIYGQDIVTYAGLGSQMLFGDNITVGQYMESMVLMGADISAPGTGAVSGEGQCVGIGNSVTVTRWRNTAVGFKATCESVSDTAYGWAAWCKGTSGNHRVAIGRAAMATGGGSTVIGSHTNSEIWFSNGEVHKFTNPVTGAVETELPTARTVIVHIGRDAWDQQDTPDAFNVAGGPGAIAPGVPTGSGSRAKLHFYQADGVDLGQNTKQALQSVGYVDLTGDLVWWDLIRLNKISATASCIVASTVSSGNIATDYALKISNEATSINSKSATSLLLKIANVTRIDITANATTLSNRLELLTGTTSFAPLKFTSGTNLATPVAGSMEYNGTNLFFTRSGTTRESVICANAVNSTSPTNPNRTITVNIDGTTYYIHAKTTND
jgi:hypothetical protein